MRTAYTVSVINFGAKGDGVTDDWAAIMRAFNWTVATNRGTIYFPPGTYLVSQPINFMVTADHNVKSHWSGEPGLSVITGNFADYILSRGINDTDRSEGPFVIEKLTIVNTNALGGGIRFGEVEGGAIRNCVITANKCINTVNIDALIGGGFYWGSFEVSIEGCTLSPGANVSGSIGIQSCSNGPILGCRIDGFATGMTLFAGEGAAVVKGCYFANNGVALLPGVGPGNLGNSGTSNFIISGCWFKNNGVAIQPAGISAALFEGIFIEGATGAAPGGTNPQYGIFMDVGQCGNSVFRGIDVSGQYDHAGVWLTGGETTASNNSFKGVRSINTGSGVNWHIPATAATAQFVACNVAPVFPMAALPATNFGVSSASWSANAIASLGAITGGSGGTQATYPGVALTGGTGSGATADIHVSGGGSVDSVSLTLTSAGSGYTNGDVLSAAPANIGGTSGFSIPVTSVVNQATVTCGMTALVGSFFQSNGTWGILVSGVNPSGYNGSFVGTPAAFNKLTFPIASNPGAYVSGGSVLAVPVNDGGVPAVFEGQSFNVSNADTATQGANPSGTPGSNHVKLRWNGSNWVVVGK